VPTFDRRRLNTGLLGAVGSLLMPRIARGAQRRADLVVTSLQWSDDDGLTWHNGSVPAQSNLLFRAKVRNAGTAAFPAPKRIRVDFRVNGSLVAWSDTYRSGLSAGASKLLVANTGPDGDAVWYDAPAGTHTVLARIDPLNSYTELNESNNTRSATLTVDPLPNSPEISATLPFFAQYYGSDIFARNAANSTAHCSGEKGTWFFFYAEHTGEVSHVLYHVRYGAGYSSGSSGQYELEIRVADPVTREPKLGVQPICYVDLGTVTWGTSGFYNKIVEFTKKGVLTGKQPYAFIVRHKGGGYFSVNIGNHNNRQDLARPSGINPANVGTVPAAVEGWSPVRIDGTLDLRPWPCRGKHGDGEIQEHRKGPDYSSYRYSDGVWVGAGWWGSTYNENYTAAVNGSGGQCRVPFRVTRASRTVSGAFILLPRLGTSGGSVNFDLELAQQVDARPAGNGTLIERVTAPDSVFTNVGSGYESTDVASWVWLPFKQNRVLELGRVYNARISATGAFKGVMWGGNREAKQYSGGTVDGTTWARWEATRKLPMTAWEDSRGAEKSSNGGSSWTKMLGEMMPVLFKCV
jgi:CARDB